jgi:hypothetical protein
MRRFVLATGGEGSERAVSMASAAYLASQLPEGMIAKTFIFPEQQEELLAFRFVPSLISSIDRVYLEW